MKAGRPEGCSFDLVHDALAKFRLGGVDVSAVAVGVDEGVRRVLREPRSRPCSTTGQLTHSARLRMRRPARQRLKLTAIPTCRFTRNDHRR
jgi:hypothetical protein